MALVAISGCGRWVTDVWNGKTQLRQLEKKAEIAREKCWKQVLEVESERINYIWNAWIGNIGTNNA